MAVAGKRTLIGERLLALGCLENVLLYNSADVLADDLQSIGFTTRLQFEARRALVEESAKATHVPIKRLMLYDLQTFLRSLLNRNDRMTMAASIECRVPFLSKGLVEAALKLPESALFSWRHGKQVLCDYAADLLPKEVLWRPKWGLGIPWYRYFRHDATQREFVSNLHKTELGRMLQAPGLRKAIEVFLAGDDQKGPIVYQVFALAIWWEQDVGNALSSATNRHAGGCHRTVGTEQSTKTPSVIAERVPCC